MCGILGRISLTEKIDACSMKRALDLMIHRGPDAAGVWMNTSENICFGHRRLSILDLSELGTQPMVSFDGSLVIVFNGEIYNFKSIKNELRKKGYEFRSESDTEVLLNAWHCWKEETLQKIDGMFAFAILDTANNSLVLARDRMGEKPLYYQQTNNGIVFASELKAILSINGADRQINHLALDCLLGFGYVPGDLCIIKGVKKLPQSSYLTYSIGDDNPNVKTYWNYPLPTNILSQENLLIEKLDTLLGNSVRSQIVADVPVGVMLSGGLDSSLITAYAAEADKDVYTFTVGFEGYGGADERHFARQVAQWFGTRHKELNITGADPEVFSLLAAQCCEPSTDPAIIPGYLIYKAASEHCKVVMGGDGGDEIFGGYDRYETWKHLKQKYGNLPSRFRSLIASSAEIILPIGFKGRHSLMQMDTDFENSLPLKDNLFTEEERRNLLPNLWNVSDTNYVKNDMVTHNLEFLERAMRYDMKGFLPDNILTKVDRSSMLSSVEVRSPFLSKEILEFSLGGINTEMKRRKKILRHLAKQKLPDFFNFQRKQGFVPPLEYWMKEKKWQEFINDNLFSSDSIFNNKMLNNFMKGEGKRFFNKRRLFSLLMIQLWMQSNNIKN
jgi:asparagine synthase (glutamine-hydrolysing)